MWSDFCVFQYTGYTYIYMIYDISYIKGCLTVIKLRRVELFCGGSCGNWTVYDSIVAFEWLSTMFFQ